MITKLTNNSFKFDDIDVIYPIYIKSNKTSEYYDLKKVMSNSNYSRKYQLNNRSVQSRLFDLLIDIDYFNVEIIKEMVLINTRFDIDSSRSYYLLDYFIPSKSLCIELDSDLHNPDRDELKDKFLNSLGIEVLRVKDFQVDSKFKLDQISNWIESKPVRKFEINYSSLIPEYEEYSKNKAIDKLKETKGELYFIRDKWYEYIKRLCKYNKNLEIAITSKSLYSLTMSLDTIFQLIPMSEKKVKYYNSLVNYLKTLGIELKINTTWGRNRFSK